MEAVVWDGAGRAIPAVRDGLVLLCCCWSEAAEAPRPEGGMINVKSIYLSRNAEVSAPLVIAPRSRDIQYGLVRSLVPCLASSLPSFSLEI